MLNLEKTSTVCFLFFFKHAKILTSWNSNECTSKNT